MTKVKAPPLPAAAAPWDDLETKTEREERKLQGVSADWDFSDIIKEGDYHRQKSAEHILAFSKCVKALKDRCQVVRGGSKFTRRIKEAWGLSANEGVKYLAIGEAEPYFNNFVNVLPPHYTTLHKLTQLPEAEFIALADSKQINPRITGNAAQALLPPPLTPTKQHAKKMKEVGIDTTEINLLLSRIYMPLGREEFGQRSTDRRSAIKLPSTEILNKNIAAINKELDALVSSAGPKTPALQFIAHVLAHINEHYEEFVRVNVPEAMRELNKQLLKREAAVAAKEADK